MEQTSKSLIPANNFEVSISEIRKIITDAKVEGYDSSIVLDPANPKQPKEGDKTISKDMALAGINYLEAINSDLKKKISDYLDPYTKERSRILNQKRELEAILLQASTLVTNPLDNLRGQIIDIQRVQHERQVQAQREREASLEAERKKKEEEERIAREEAELKRREAERLQAENNEAEAEKARIEAAHLDEIANQERESAEAYEKMQEMTATTPAVTQDRSGNTTITTKEWPEAEIVSLHELLASLPAITSDHVKLEKKIKELLMPTVNKWVRAHYKTHAVDFRDNKAVHGLRLYLDFKTSNTRRG